MHSKSKRRGLLTTAALVIAGSALVTTSAGASLPGSTFEGNDGNFVPNGGTDWTSPAPGLVVGTEVFSGQQDSSLGQGSAENDTTVTVGFGSIPNSKANLSQFLVGSEQGANGHTYLYLGWTRANQGGTTNFDFEINKLEQPDMTTAGSKVLNRSVGDLLINYLFQGQGTPVVEIRTWTALGVWSLPTSGVVAEAAISTTSQANPFGVPNPVPAGQFGETSIDLTASGIIGVGECKGFSSAYVKSRSSTSFSSELKDFVPPQHVNIATCASITVVKETVPSPDLSNTNFPFVASYDADGFSLHNGEFNDSGDLVAGTYSVNETPVPSNWELTSATCDDGSPINAIVLSANEHVTCTFTNTLKTGAILIHKDRKFAAEGPGDHPHAGVEFDVNGTKVTTDGNGNACVDGLTFGGYVVTETVPAGYQSDDSVKEVTVDNTATCEQDPYVGETVNFVNTPLTDVLITVDSQVLGGTSSTITCEGQPVAGPGGNISLEVTNASPQTLNCVIVIDP